jgi:hypothetical integral membrane protein (TIGR02206 family)
VPLFGPVHLALIAATAAIAWALSALCRAGRVSHKAFRYSLGLGLAANEFVWWWFRYSREGVRLDNLPLQLCDLTVWLSVAECLTLAPGIVEFNYFAGLTGAGMAVLTPDLWSPWPSYPAIYFFVAHGGIVVAASVLVFGRIAAPLRRGAVWRAYAYLLSYTIAVGIFNAVTGANYMFLRYKPESGSLLDLLGPWPLYVIAGAALALGFFWLLWLPAWALGAAQGTKTADPA